MFCECDEHSNQGTSESEGGAIIILSYYIIIACMVVHRILA